MSLASGTLTFGSLTGPALKVVVPAAAALAIGAALTVPPLQVFALEAVLLCCMFAVARLEFERLLVAWLWMMCLVHLFKRAIFLLGPQPQSTYYSVLLLATAAFVPLAALALGSVGRRALPRSARVLGLFVLWILFQTLLPSAGTTVVGRFAAVHERILPMMGFAVGLVMPLGSRLFGVAASTILTTGVVSTFYGFFLAWNGPTFIERAWAVETAPYSIQGWNVLTAIEARSPDWQFRSFSFLADHLTWGLLLVAAIACLLATTPAGRPRSSRWWLSLVLLIGGLVVSLTRTPWAGLFAMTATWVLLRRRTFARPFPLMILLAAGFALVVTVGGFIYSTMMPQLGFTALFDSPVLDRYLTVGTLEVRISAWHKLARAVVDYPLLGEGLAYGDYFLRPFGQETEEDIGGHNFLVETTVCTGAVGTVIFLVFLYHLLLEGTRAPAGTRLPNPRRWLVAFVVGYVMTGYFNGGNFMNAYFFLLAGSLAAAPGPGRDSDDAERLADPVTDSRPGGA